MMTMLFSGPATALRRYVGIVGACLSAVACDELTTALQPDPSTIDPDDIISVSSDATGAIQANGTSTVRLSAHIPRAAAVKTVVFTSTIGTFVESGGKTVSIRAVDDPARDGKSVASTLLRADTLAGVAIARATVGEFYDTLSVQFVKP